MNDSQNVTHLISGKAGLRELYVRSGQGFLLVFSITSASSLHELIELREEIIRLKDDPYVPIVLVGNKADLEDDRAVSRSQAFKLSQDWGNTPYYESSARSSVNVDQAFINLCQQILTKENEYIRKHVDDRTHRRGRSRHQRREHSHRHHPRRDDRRNARRQNSLCTIL